MSTYPASSRPLRVTAVAILAIPFFLAVAGCNKETPTSPTTTTPPETVIPPADPTMTKEFNGVVRVGGSSFYSFTVEQGGIVRVRLNRVSGTNVPPTVWLGLGLGTPSGEDCATTTSLNTQVSEVAQIQGTYAAGIYCAKVYDIGNLLAPATFYVTIDHP